MLTINPPIQPKAHSPITSSQEGFCSRIRGFYDVIPSTLGSADLLHMVTAPPQVYIEDTGVNTLFNNTNIIQKRQEHIEIVNQLLNRIVVSADTHLTYQDRVFITDVLHKIGIKDDKRFMKQVNKLFEQTNNTNRLLSLYMQHSGELHEIVERVLEETDTPVTKRAGETYRPGETTIIRQTDTLRDTVYMPGADITFPASSETGDAVTELTGETTESEIVSQTTDRRSAINYTEEQYNTQLYKDIFNRLQTDNIYREVASFYNNSLYNSFITSQEMQLSEQQSFSRNILLNRFESYVKGEEVPLLYRQDNYYTENAVNVENEGEVNVENSLTSAVLLDMADKIYKLRYNDIKNTETAAYNTINALYQSSDNELNRFRLRMESFISGNSYQRTYEQFDNRSYEKQINIMERLFESGDSPLYFLRDREDHTESETVREREVSEETVRELTRAGETIREDVKSLIESGRAEFFNVKELSENTELTANEIERINTQNIINQNRYLENLEQLTANITQSRDKSPTNDPVSREAILSLEHPENILNEAPDGEGTDAPQSIGDPEEIRALLGEFYNITENTELTARDLERINTQNIINQSRYMENLERLSASITRKRPQEPSMDRSKREALMALEHPDEVIEQFMEEAEIEEAHRKERDNLRIEALPDGIKEVYELINNYLESPGQRSEAATENALNRLGADIMMIEGDKRSLSLTFDNRQSLIENTAETLLMQYERAIKKEEEAGNPPPALPERQVLIHDAISIAEAQERAARDAKGEPESIIREEILRATEKTLHEIEIRTGSPISPIPITPGDIHEGESLVHLRAREIIERQAIKDTVDTVVESESERVIRQDLLNVVERIGRDEYKKNASPVIKHISDTISSIEMVHKANESIIDEELLEEIRNQTRETKVATTAKEENINTTESVKTKVVNETFNTVEETTKNIEELVRNTVRSQLGSISDRVYSKLERKLANERKRRGF